jgi:hypothetical protein
MFSVLMCGTAVVFPCDPVPCSHLLTGVMRCSPRFRTSAKMLRSLAGESRMLTQHIMLTQLVMLTQHTRLSQHAMQQQEWPPPLHSTL